MVYAQGVFVELNYLNINVEKNIKYCPSAMRLKPPLSLVVLKRTGKR